MNNNCNQIFSPARLAAYLNSFVHSERKSIITMLTGIPLTFIVIGAFTGYNANPFFDRYGNDIMWGTMSVLQTLIFFLFSAISGSQFYCAMSSRAKRINTLMVPASQLEKFLASFMVFSLGFYVIFFISAYLGEFTRLLASEALTPNGDYTRLRSFSDILSFGTRNESMEIWMTYLTSISSQALFALGSIVFMKNPFLKSALSYFVIWGVTVTLATISVVAFFSHRVYELDFVVWNGISKETAQVAVIAATLIFTALVYWLTYARQKETEYIQRW